MLGAAAFASVIVLALGGLTLVGLDTVGAKGMQLSRVAQPEVAQAPEVSREETSSDEADSGEGSDSGEQASAASDEDDKSDKTSADEKASDDSGDSASKEESSEQESSSLKATKSTAEKEEQQEAAEKQEKQEAAEKQEKQEKREEPEPPPDPQSKTMWMSIPSLGMQSDTVYNSGSHEQMGVGAIKLPPTGFPWQGGANTYISAHRIGYPGTQSHNQFYNLPAMQQGDVIYVGDANGTTYEYRVTEKFAVKPWENWVTEPEAGKDMLTLQTCVDSLDPNTWWDISPKLMRSGPDSARLIVQAEKVDTYYPQSY